jgi:hypothetical protein
MNFKLLKTIVCFAVIVTVSSCAGKKEESHQHEDTDQKEWKEMDDFHFIMAETFHPYKDSANLGPVKSRVGELVSSAEKWASAKLPDKVNTDEMKGKLEELKNELAVLAQTVSSGDDKAIGERLTKVHDLFHNIQEDWYGGGEHDHGHEH